METNDKRPNYFWLFFILIVFLITLGVLVYFVKYKTSISPKASFVGSSAKVSLSNSYVFASPIRALANGDLIRVTVFLLDDEGNGIFDKKITLKPDSIMVNIKEVQSLTDETGKAVFDLSSTVTGTYTIEALSPETILPQRIKVVFD